MGLKGKDLSEKDYRKLILEEYTFLKRPTVVIDDEVFVCTTKAEVEAAVNKMNNG
jgi:arsenate reductase